MKNSTNFVLVLILSITFACNDDVDDSNAFNVADLIASQVEQQISPSVSNFVTTTSELNKAIELYVNQTTESNLLDVRTKWERAVLAYEKVYSFNIGEVRENFLHLIIYPWPVSTNAIENVLINNIDINQELIDNLSPRAKTFAALEYLLFKDDITSTNNDYLTSNKRLIYLKFLGNYVYSLSQRIDNIWSVDGNNYANSLVNNRETGIDGSFNLFFNGIYNAIDTGKVTKIGKPAGLEKSSVTNPELTQAHFSNSSLALLRASIQSIENAYFNANGIGIDDYVSSITKNGELNKVVQERIRAVYAAIDVISPNLAAAIDSQPLLLSELHTTLNDLRITFGVDIRSTLSIVITSTDNDGD